MTLRFRTSNDPFGDINVDDWLVLFLEDGGIEWGKVTGYNFTPPDNASTWEVSLEDVRGEAIRVKVQQVTKYFNCGKTMPKYIGPRHTE